MASFELREYKVRRDKQKAWLKVFDEEVMPFGGGPRHRALRHGESDESDESDESVFIWTRRFNSEKERVRLCDAVYSDP